MSAWIRTPRALWRLARCGFHLLAGIARCAVVFPFIAGPQRLVQTGQWCERMARILGLHIELRGASPHRGATLIVSNHISWLDILAINAVHPARFVSKADVRAWPILGWLVASGGTLFIARERKRDALRVVHQIAEALTQGDTIALFPEGTTGDGRALLPFHANLFQAAVATGTAVQPVALSYLDADGQPSRIVVWIGDTTLASSLWDVVAADHIRVIVTQLPAVATQGRERRELAEAVESQIGRTLGLKGSSTADSP